MNNLTKTAISGGNIRRSRVVYMSDQFTVLEMSVATSFPPFGIVQDNSRKAPGTAFDTSLFAAASGDELLVWAAGSVALAECGNTVTAGKMVTVDSTARIINSTYGAATSLPVLFGWEVGKALENGAAGDMIRIEVMPQRASTS